MKYIKQFIVGTMMLLLFAGPATLPQAVFAAEPGSAGRSEACKAIGGGGCGGSDSQLSSVIKTAIEILSAVGAIAAIITIIVGGIRYITSGGDAANVSSAKNTILYALVGLIVVAFAQIIVRFVLERT
jgi:Type IV secretion system pilin